MLEIVHVEPNFDTQDSDTTVWDNRKQIMMVLPWSSELVQEAVHQRMKLWALIEGYHVDETED